jgi:hypothetical protein
MAGKSGAEAQVWIYQKMEMNQNKEAAAEDDEPKDVPVLVPVPIRDPDAITDPGATINYFL